MPDNTAGAAGVPQLGHAHLRGDASLRDLTWTERPWNGAQAYSDSKLHDILLALAVARRWPEVLVSAVSPGWVATKMGGAGANDSLTEAPVTQAWLAGSRDPAALVTGKYWYHQQPVAVLPAAADLAVQERFMTACAELTGVTFPGSA